MSAKIIDALTDRAMTPQRKSATRNRLRGLCWCGKPPKPDRSCCQRCIDRATRHQKAKHAQKLASCEQLPPADNPPAAC